MKSIGKYRIRGLLGRGGMARVYKVELPVIGKIAALKRLAPHPSLVSLLGMETIRRLFVTEATTMARLRHPNLLGVWGFEADGDHPFYLMDYHANNLGVMTGENYRIESPSRKLPVEKVIDYARQTLLGLARLHHAGIVHRDIKPYNLLVTEQDIVKICDFGLSKLRGEKFKGPRNLKVGSPYYASPEQEKDPDSVDFSSDLYAVGVMIYRMLTGRLPEDREPSRFVPDLDTQWDRFIAVSLSPEPGKRFPSAKEMLAALQRLETAWNRARAEACELQNDSPEQETPAPARTGAPRETPVKVRPAEARSRFDLDRLWRPAVFYGNDFVSGPDGTLFDRCAGRLWERSGSPYPLTWKEAQRYIDGLNKTRFAGRKDWRLPTIDELVSLLTDPARGTDLCIEPVFDTTQKWLWSCDRQSFVAAWYVNIELGFVGWHDFSGYFYARGVAAG